jgi:membrane-associated phospholipid phosphatase
MSSLKTKTIHVFQFMGRHLRRFMLLLYLPVYSIIFSMLERRENVNFHIISLPIDYKIPFIEIFIIPYVIWFGFVTAGIVITVFSAKSRDFMLMYMDLVIGMTIFVIISAVFPNKLDLRPLVMPRDNIFTHMVRGLYSIDTPTNVMPSIHVYNTIGICFGLGRTDWFKRHKKINAASFIIGFLIIISTVFIKQHGLLDVGLAILMQAVAVPLLLDDRRNHLAMKFVKWYDPKYA